MPTIVFRHEVPTGARYRFVTHGGLDCSFAGTEHVFVRGADQHRVLDCHGGEDLPDHHNSCYAEILESQEEPNPMPPTNYELPPIVRPRPPYVELPPNAPLPYAPIGLVQTTWGAGRTAPSAEYMESIAPAYAGLIETLCANYANFEYGFPKTHVLCAKDTIERCDYWFLADRVWPIVIAFGYDASNVGFWVPGAGPIERRYRNNGTPITGTAVDFSYSKVYAWFKNNDELLARIREWYYGE